MTGPTQMWVGWVPLSKDTVSDGIKNSILFTKNTPKTK